MLDEVPQQRRLHQRQRHPLVADPHFELLEVDRLAAETRTGSRPAACSRPRRAGTTRGGAAARARATGDRQLERLRQVVVGAGAEIRCSTSSDRPRAVSISTGTNWPAAAARPRPRTRRCPAASRRGSRGRSAPARRRAAPARPRPLSTTSTSCCSASRLKRSPSARCCSSSTTRMRLIAAAGERQLHGERAAAPGPVALGEHLAAVPRDHRSDDEQAQPGALDARRHRRRECGRSA